MEDSKTTHPRGGRPFGSRTRPRPFDRNALLCVRAQTAAVLNTSMSKVIGLEKSGKLDVIRLDDNPKSMAYHRVRQVLALAGETETERVRIKRPAERGT
jgi:hypothetical protein